METGSRAAPATTTGTPAGMRHRSQPDIFGRPRSFRPDSKTPERHEPVRLASLESRVFITLVLLTSGFFLWMIRGFLVPIFWAVVFAVLFQPLVRRLTESFGERRSAAAAAATLIVVVLVLVPFALLVVALAQQALTLYQRVSAGEMTLEAPLALLDRLIPPATDMLARFGIGPERLQEQLSSLAAATTEILAAQALALGQNALRTTILFAIMLYLLFFLFRDGERIVAGLVRVVPMGDERERRLLEKFATVSRATVKGTLVVAVVQGTLGGLLFWAVGIDAAIFWGVVMGILSILPAVGPALVWGPAAIILFATGALVQGIVLIVIGTLLIGLVDNFLRPILVGRETEMPDYLVLLATLGGLSVFGLAGFVAGPIVAALCLVLWEMVALEYGEIDSSVPLAVADAAPVPVIEVDPAGSSGAEMESTRERTGESEVIGEEEPT
jgi:predicted PurR-regulated permease PerM